MKTDSVVARTTSFLIVQIVKKELFVDEKCKEGRGKKKQNPN